MKPYINEAEYKVKLQEHKALSSEEKSVRTEEQSALAERIRTYKDLTIRKKYRKVSLRYTILLSGVFLICIIMKMVTGFSNPVLLAFLCFVGFGMVLHVADLVWLCNATKRFDCYTRTLAIDDLLRIERCTNDFGGAYQLIFMEEEMIFCMDRMLAAYAYQSIGSVCTRGKMVELFDSEKNSLGVVPDHGLEVTGVRNGKRTIMVLQTVNPQIEVS